MSDIKVVSNKKEFEIAYKIRVKVFVEEQKVSLEMELDEEDKIATHIILYENDKPIGCGRIIFNDKIAKMGRIAVLKEKRKKGYGEKICKELINIAKEHKIKEIKIHAQCSAIGFYKKLGFTTCSAEFYEAGIKHIEMMRKI